MNWISNAERMRPVAIAAVVLFLCLPSGLGARPAQQRPVRRLQPRAGFAQNAAPRRPGSKTSTEAKSEPAAPISESAKAVPESAAARIQQNQQNITAVSAPSARLPGCRAHSPVSGLTRYARPAYPRRRPPRQCPIPALLLRDI